jgi:hypothetical protein
VTENPKASVKRVTFAEDRFDDVPKKGKRSGQIGAHRVVARQGHFWQWLLVMLIVTVLLSAAGIFTLHRIGANNVPFAQRVSESEEKPQEVKAKLDPSATVAVLNGTDTTGLGEAVGDAVGKNKWGDVQYIGNTKDTATDISAVFYGDKDDQAAAEGLADKLGGVSTYLNKTYESIGTKLVILVGPDYAGPGKDDVDKTARPDNTFDLDDDPTDRDL